MPVINSTSPFIFEIDIMPFIEKYYLKDIAGSAERIEKYLLYAEKALQLNDDCQEYDDLLDEMDDMWWDMEPWEREAVEEEIVMMSEEHHEETREDC